MGDRAPDCRADCARRAGPTVSRTRGRPPRRSPRAARGPRNRACQALCVFIGISGVLGGSSRFPGRESASGRVVVPPPARSSNTAGRARRSDLVTPLILTPFIPTPRLPALTVSRLPRRAADAPGGGAHRGHGACRAR